jgi:hypothetical protein
MADGSLALALMTGISWIAGISRNLIVYNMAVTVHIAYLQGVMIQAALAMRPCPVIT